MKAIEIKKGQIINVPAEYQDEEGCVAFQMVEFSYMFYGSKQTDTLDTKILKDGTQIVINGNGFISEGTTI